jgi:hypothetical protein
MLNMFPKFDRIHHDVFAHVGEGTAAFQHPVVQHGQIVPGENQVGRFPGHVGRALASCRCATSRASPSHGRTPPDSSTR